MATNMKVEEHSESSTTTATVHHRHRSRALHNYHGFWYCDFLLPKIIGIHELDSNNNDNKSRPRPTDIIIASFPKSGTTWLKALAFSILNRDCHPPGDPNHPLLTSLHAQDCAPFLEANLISLNPAVDPDQFESMPSPRLITTHVPYHLLPPSLRNNKIIYICRDPKDTFVSSWHFINAADATTAAAVSSSPSPLPIEDAFEQCCEGVVRFGPMWDHWLGYWRESLRKPDTTVLFFKYEDLMVDGAGCVRKIAEFLGCPFSSEEEGFGMADEIARLCSFERLSGAPVSKEGTRGFKGIFEAHNSSYYRKGKLGDWANYLTPEMGRRLDEIVQHKLHRSGLTFK